MSKLCQCSGCVKERESATHKSWPCEKDIANRPAPPPSPPPTYRSEPIKHKPEWDGIGIPPVGTVCEITLKGNSFHECEVVVMSKVYVIVRFTSNGLENVLGKSEAYFRRLAK